MGIPGLSSWLKRKYPDIIEQCKETESVLHPLDEMQPNLNGIEFDNLYLDMNEIIHSSTATDACSTSKNEDEIIKLIVQRIDRIFSIIRPRKLLYMAIDGVSPMAKMHHQRAGPFLDSKNNLDKGKQFDKNLIKPGTPFMSKLSNYLQDYIRALLNTNSAWRSIKVILSDANVPGEGEHKIMDYIRAQLNHDSKTYHVLFGADSDLILLGLTTHTNCFRIMRESTITIEERKTYEFIDISVLRENLKNYLKSDDLSQFQWNPECAIDDWVFMCFLAGNDFFPNLPSIQFFEDAMDPLIDTYKIYLLRPYLYLTENGQLNMVRLKILLKHFGEKQDEIFTRQHQDQSRSSIHQSANRHSKFSVDQVKAQSSLAERSTSSFGPAWMTAKSAPSSNKSTEVNIPPPEIQVAEASAAVPTNSPKRDQRDGEISEESIAGRRREKDWREEYYESKFEIDLKDLEEFRTRVVHDYARGLLWILQYYYKGVPSWDWYYPHHYAPFASDFSKLGDVREHFNPDSEPLKPLEQLMAIFPPQYANYLPEQWQKLMLAKNSPIIEFYPTDFIVDPNGKQKEWQGVVLLPFVDKERLQQALESVYSTLTPKEETRNQRNYDLLFNH